MNDEQPLDRCDPSRLAHALVLGGKTTEAHLDAALAEVGLTSARWRALRQLAEANSPLALSQLAERLACVRSNVTQLVDRLESEQLVRRVYDPADRRSIQAEITALGRQRYEAGQALIEEFERRLLAGFGVEERQVLGQLLARLAAFAREGA
jgi:DNA-binding MarR family transcriptional regulator